MKPPFHKVEHNWQFTTIYDSDDNPICEFNLEWFHDLTEETQESLEAVMQERVDFVLERLNNEQ